MASELLKKLEEDAEELSSLLASASRERTKGALAAELRKVETEMSVEKERRVADDSKDKRAASATSRTAAYDVQIKNFSWDQSDKFVKIYLTGLDGVQSLPGEAVRPNFAVSSVDIKVEGLKGKNHCFAIKETCEKIVPDKSYIKIKSDMVSVFLKKSSDGEKWGHLRAVEKAAAKEKMKPPPKSDDSSDPGAGLMNLMKQMYDDGDDEMKRTIAKAWTESRDKTPEMPNL